MPYSLEQIQNEMLQGLVKSPETVADYRVFLSALYSLKEAQHDEVRKGYAETWLKMRDLKDSDAATDREWQRTPAGQEERRLTSEKRRIDKLIQALSTKMKALEGESRNLY